MLTRVVYAVNWYNIASIFSQIASDFGTRVSGLGLLTSSLYLALAIFQVPGGLLAARYGPRRVSFLGVLIASSCSLAVAFSADITEAILLRFAVGLGMAFFFAPGLSLAAKYFRSGAEGLGIGLYSSAFDLGGALGLFGWAVLAASVGWRQSLVTSGMLGVATAFLLLLALPKEEARDGFRLRFAEVRSIMLDRRLLILSFNLLGQGIGSTLVGSFMVFYLEDSLGLSYQFSGSVGALVLLIPFLLSPAGGRIYDRSKRVSKLMLLSGLAMVFGASVPAIGHVYAAVAATVIIGVASSVGFTV